MLDVVDPYGPMNNMIENLFGFDDDYDDDDDDDDDDYDDDLW